jgi:quinol monooxygenase YgiN
MVRVIIGRRCQPDRAAELENLLLELRTNSMKQCGYISGETLRSVDDPSLWLVISTWVDADLWKVWETMPERREIQSRIEPLLIGMEKVSIFSFAGRGGAESAHTIDR